MATNDQATSQQNIAKATLAVAHQLARIADVLERGDLKVRTTINSRDFEDTVRRASDDKRGR